MGGISLKKEGKKYNRIMRKAFSHNQTDNQEEYLQLLEEQDKRMHTIQKNKFAYYMLNLKAKHKDHHIDTLNAFKLLEYSLPNNTIDFLDNSMIDDGDNLNMIYGFFKISLKIDLEKKKVIVNSELCRLYKYYHRDDKIFHYVIDGSTATIPYYDAVEFIYNMKTFSLFANVYKETIRENKKKVDNNVEKRKKRLSARKIASILSK